MTTAIPKHTERMPIISRYRRWRYAMSSVRDRRACVTMCTEPRRPGWLILTLPRYAQAPNPATPSPREFTTAQLAGLTEDMLKPSTRTGGIAARLK